jgi:hypothetical protein
MAASSISTCVSRSKLIAPLIMLAIVFGGSLLGIGFFVPLAIATLQAGQMPGPKGMMMTLGCITLAPLFLWTIAVVLRRIVSPDTLEISTSGIAVTKFGKPQYYTWASLGEPQSRLGRDGEPLEIRLTVKASSETLSLPARFYCQRFDIVLSALQEARKGRLPAWPSP